MLRRGAWWWRAAALAWMLLMFWMSSRSDLPDPVRFPEWIPLDKLAHVLLFAVLGGLLHLAGLRIVPAAVAAALYGLSDEIHQMYVPGRSPDVRDWFADVIGAVIGIYLVRFPSRRTAPDSEPVE